MTLRMANMTDGKAEKVSVKRWDPSFARSKECPNGVLRPVLMEITAAA